jgi:hypothetical protein
MAHEDWLDHEWVDLNEAVKGDHNGSAQGMSLDGWQMAGVFLLCALVAPALIKGTSEAVVECLGAALLSSPLLAWLLIPLRRSDDLFDQTNQRRAEYIDTLAIVLIWTWPWTCVVPLAAVARSLLIILPQGS